MLSGELHCEYCHCPKEVWKKSLTTYDGDECQLYDSFLSLIYDGITAQELFELAAKELPKEFSDIENIGATAAELVQIVIDCGVIQSEQSPTNQNLERVKQCAALAIEDNTRQFGRGFAHSATTATIGYLISGMENLISEVGALKPEEILECIKFTLEYLHNLLKDESIPWETTAARLVAGKRKKTKR